MSGSGLQCRGVVWRRCGSRSPNCPYNLRPYNASYNMVDMGYTTTYSGQVTVAPPLTAAEVADLRSFADRRHDDSVHPSYYCQWVPTDDGTAIEWDGSEKFYCGQEWMAWLIGHLLAPAGHVLDGTVQAQGEDVGDVWTLKVVNNEVSRVEWGPQGDV